ncbi:MAG: NAD(P)H-dependent flavin oxidoreductase [Candidatus Sericytochromatia bacterium]
MTKLPSLVIGDLEIPVPIVQGGMGVRIGGPRLVSSVANYGGLGTLSAMGLCPVDTKARDFKRVGNESLIAELDATRALMPGKPLAINVMVAATNWEQLVRTSAEHGVDLIVSGAGLPLKMPEIVEGTKAKIAPIISSGRAAALICKAWARQGRYPDAIVLEGPRAGGHLGFTVAELENPRPLEDILVEVLTAIEPHVKAAGRPIPVIAAGGIYDGADIARLLAIGAAAVQMGTRFVATHECDAHDTFKDQFVKCREEDIVIITSPVGMPLRAIRNEWLQDIIDGERKKFKCSYKCLHTCNAAKVQYCIADALYKADVEGDLYQGFVICGSTTHRIQDLRSVNELMDELVTGAEAAFAGVQRVVPAAEGALVQ